MWFKQLTVYPLLSDTIPDTQTINERLLYGAFAPCLGLDWFSEGFVPSTAFSKEMTFPVQDSLRITLQREEKVLPSAVINQAVRQRVTDIRHSENRQVGRRERSEIKEAVIDTMLPRAFSKLSHTHAIIDTRNCLLLIDTASNKKAENFLGRLREAMQGFPAAQHTTTRPIKTLMTEWLLSGVCDGNFQLESDSTMKDSGESAAVIKAAKQDLTAEEIANLARHGKTVTQLGLCWQERISFILTEDLSFKRIAFLDSIRQEAEEHGDNAEQLLYASQLLMTVSLVEMIQELVQLLGGRQIDVHAA